MFKLLSKYFWLICVIGSIDSAKAATTATVTLKNLPASQTTATAANITYTLNNASTGYTVYCRRDSFAAIACPNPFILGVSAPLALGTHRVDFYIKKGSTLPSTPDATYSWNIVAPLPQAPTLSLSNLPSNPTTSTSASIGYSVSGGTSSTTVYCRRDSYTPIVCSNPFSLGTSTALASGSHTVDFFLDTGSGIDATKPAKSYSWLIASPTPTATPTPSPTVSPVPVPSGVTPLASLVPNSVMAGGYDYIYRGATISSTCLDFNSDGSCNSGFNNDGIVRTQAFTNVQNTGKPGYLKRIVYGDPKSSGSGNRAEFGFENVKLVLGVDYWWSFAIKIIPGEWHGNEPSTSDQIFFQIHQDDNGGACCGPTFAMQTHGNGNTITASRAYGPLNPVIEESPMTPTSGVDMSRPADGVWTRFIVHLRFGTDTSYNPVIQVWRNEETTPLYNRSGSNAIIGNPGTTYYARIGFYKWNYSSGDYGNAKTRAAYYSDLYFGQGTNLYNEATAAVQSFR